MNYDNPRMFLALTSLIAAVSVVVSSLEILSIRGQYETSGLFSWTVQRVRFRALRTNRFSRIADLLFEYPNVLWLVGIRIIAACSIVIVFGNRTLLLVASSVIAVISVLLTIRGRDGRSGADQMYSLIFVSLSLSLLSNTGLVWKVELWFLALQLNLSYMTSGIFKAKERGWRDGSYLRIAFRTEAYGNERLWKLLEERPWIARIASLAVIALECGFFVSLILPLNYSWPILMAGALFHIANAVISGLNTFFWSYLALYPAVVFCGHVTGVAVLSK